MRESFVFHISFIDSLPDDRKSEFTCYAVNYGLYGEEPVLDDMALAFWRTVKSRIDIDKAQYDERVKKQNEARKKYREKLSEISGISKISQDIQNIADNPINNEISGNICPNSHSEFEFEFDNEFEFDIEFDIDTDIDAKKSPQLRYSDMLFQKWKDASLPGSKDSISFFQKEFKNAILSLKGIHSKDVLGACDNYISVINNPQCYLKNKWAFDRFVKSKVFSDFIPDRFDLSNFKKFNLSGPSSDSELSNYDFKKIQVGGQNETS